MSLAIALLVFTTIAQAQTTAINPQLVSFVPSVDQDAVGSGGQPLVTEYHLSFFQVGSSQPVQVLNLGKPTPGVDGLITVDFSALLTSPPMPGQQLNASVSAVGPTGTSASNPSNTFMFDCTATVSPTAMSAPAQGASGAVTVTVYNGCGWQASSATSWITITSGSSGTASDSVTFNVAANPGTTTRTGTLSVGSRTVTVTQTASPAANVAPVIQMTSPANGATFTAPASITLGASANDSDGTISRVDFYANGAFVASDVAGPYAVAWPNVPAGNYTITAVATDNDGARTPSAGLSLSVASAPSPNVAPTVQVTGPGSGATFTSPANITMSASASDNGGAVTRVDFFANGTLVGSDTTGPYTATWTNVAAGNYTITATATDNLGARTTSTGVLVTVAAPPPPPPAQTPGFVAAYGFSEASGNTTADSSGNNLTGTLVNGPVRVTGRNDTGLSFNGTSTYVDLTNPAQLRLTGSMTLSAWVRETANVIDDGQIVAKSNAAGWQLKSSPDTGVRTFAIAVTGSGGMVQRYSSTVRALNTWYHVAGVYDASARTLNIYVNGVLDNGVLSGTVPASQLDIAVNANIGRRTGGFHIQGVIDDVRVYNRTLTPAEIQADMNAPVGGGALPFDFSLSNGGNKSTPQGASVTNAITASLLSGTTQPVSFAASGLPAGATATFSPASCSAPCTTTLTVATAASTPIGTSTITATGTSSSVSRSTSFSLSVTGAEDTTPPTISITSPSAGAALRGTSVAVSAMASDNVGVAGVQFILDGANLGARDTTSPYSVTWNTTTATNGPHVLAARATDASGNSTLSANVNVIVDNQPPTGSVVIKGGAAVTNSRTVTLTLTASDAPSGVRQMRFSNSGSSYSAAQAYASTKTWTLSSGAGTKTVYVQFRDVAGNWSSAVSDTIVFDNAAPTISAVTPSGVTSSSANITWTTNESATSQVEYGTTTSYGSSTAPDPALVTAHAVTLSGLAPGTTYNYRVRSRDAAGNERVGTNKTFTTPPSGLNLSRALRGLASRQSDPVF